MSAPSPSLPEPPRTTRFVFLQGETLGGPGLQAALHLAAHDPDVRVSVFERCWSAVDRDRLTIAARGLQARVWAHHADAAAYPRPGRDIPPRPLAA